MGLATPYYTAYIPNLEVDMYVHLCNILLLLAAYYYLLIITPEQTIYYGL